MVSLIGAMVVYWVLMSNFLYNTGQFIYSKLHSQHCLFNGKICLWKYLSAVVAKSMLWQKQHSQAV